MFRLFLFLGSGIYERIEGLVIKIRDPIDVLGFSHF